MSISKNYPIKFLRNSITEVDSREKAVALLNEVENSFGQPVLVKYWTNLEKTEDEIIFAIGTGTGIGPDYYKIVANTGIKFVEGVVSELPDVTKLVHGEEYIWTGSSDQIMCRVTYEESERKITQITVDEGVLVVYDVNTGFNWYVSRDSAKREDSWYSKEEIDLLISDYNVGVTTTILSLNSKIDATNDTLTNLEKDVAKSDSDMSKNILELQIEVFPLTFSLSPSSSIFEVGKTGTIKLIMEVKRKGINVTNLCTYTLNGSSISPSLSEEGTMAYSVNPTKDTTYNVVATYTPTPGLTKSASSYAYFVYRSYWGVGSSNMELTEKNITSLSESGLLRKGTMTYTSNLSNQVVIYAYPSSYGKLSHIYDANSFDYISDYTYSTISIDGVQYYVYKKALASTITNFKQQFTF